MQMGASIRQGSGLVGLLIRTSPTEASSAQLVKRAISDVPAERYDQLHSAVVDAVVSGSRSIHSRVGVAHRAEVQAWRGAKEWAAST